MPIDMQKTQYVSLLSPLKNKLGYEVTNALPGYALAAGTFVSIATTLRFRSPGIVLGDISNVQLKYDGLESFWRKIDGYVFSSYPSFSAAQYEIGALTFFTATTHTLYVYIANQTGGVVNVPAFTLRYRLNTFDAPFTST